jgi:hypothetical protein
MTPVTRSDHKVVAASFPTWANDSGHATGIFADRLTWEIADGAAASTDRARTSGSPAKPCARSAL